MIEAPEHRSQPPEGGYVFDVFISYSHEDEKSADPPRVPPLVEALEAEGVRVRWDRQLVTGDDWHEKLTGMMQTCRSMAALWSKAALKSEYCIYECTYGSAKPDRFMVFDIEPIADADFTSGVLRTVAARSNRSPYDQAAAVKAIVERVKKLRAEDKAAALAPKLKPLSEGDARAYAARVSLPPVLREAVPILVGREREETMLANAWDTCAPGADKAQKTDIVVMHALGGAGKTTLLRRLVERLEAEGFPHAEHVLGWSAYSQGSGENRNADSDAFIIEALRFLGEHGELPKDSVARARLLAERMAQSRTLLLLDGIEPLQSLPEINQGRLKDKGLAALLAGLAGGHPGLVVITSRQHLPELANRKKPSVIDHALERLDARASGHLLRHLGCWGAEREFEGAAKETDGHALSVALLGTYIATVEGGDLAKRDNLGLADIIDTVEELGAKDQTGRLAKRAGAIMKGYVARFAALRTASDGEGAAEALLLSIVGLFDRPADGPAVKALLAEPAIPGLTEDYHSWSQGMRNKRLSLARSRLRELRLIAPADKTDPDQLDAHPVVREHFGKALKAANPKAFRAAHERLYRHYEAACVKDLPDTLEEMTPLFHAIGHGCAAGLQQKAFDEVYYRRELRGAEMYMYHKLGAYAANLGALAHFFESPWGAVSPNLTEADRGVALGYAAFALRALGRLAEAEEPFAAGLALRIEQENWTNAAVTASNLSEMSLTLGRVNDAVAAGRQAVELADRSGEAFHMMSKRATLADALLQSGAQGGGTKEASPPQRSGGGGSPRSGETEGALALFEDAEARQAKRQPDLPRLYSLQGYRYCDLLLALGRAAEVRERAACGLKTVLNGSRNLQDIGLNQLADARALALFAAHGDSSAQAEAGPRLDAAVDALRRAGMDHHLPRGLLARAGYRRQAFERTSDRAHLKIADQDLTETLDIASRGQMRLFLTDHALESARLCLAQISGAPPETLVALDPPPAPSVSGLRSSPPPPLRGGGLSGAAGGRPPPRSGGGGRERSERTEGGGWWAKLFSGGKGAPPRAPSSSDPLSDPLPPPRSGGGGSPRSGETAGARAPLTPDERRLLDAAEGHFAQAAELISDTGYHRRDPELADLRRRLDLLRSR